MLKTHGHARKRTVHVYELCKGKKICEGGDEIDERQDMNGDGDGEVKKVNHDCSLLICTVRHWGLGIDCTYSMSNFSMGKLILGHYSIYVIQLMHSINAQHLQNEIKIQYCRNISDAIYKV